MEEQIKQIAERIKGLRDIYGISAEDMAKELSISLELYEQYESGTVDIPVGILYQIAHKFNIHLSSLLTGEEPRLHIYALTRNGGGVSVERRKEYKYKSLASNFVHKKAEPFLVTVEPDGDDVPVSLNSHPGQEFDYVLEGTLKIVVGGYEVILNEGDSLYYDSSVPHGMKALNGKPAKFLAMIL
ncbi:MAG TPA: cupin domain-containing protein [Bacillota bacterium]|nr:cupin domain-containing protein [Bacillota bacterium]